MVIFAPFDAHFFFLEFCFLLTRIFVALLLQINSSSFLYDVLTMHPITCFNSYKFGQFFIIFSALFGNGS